MAGRTAGSDDQRIGEIARWLIGDARLSLAPLPLIDGFCTRLLAQGVPLWRLRAGQAIANPLASAWGVIWTRDGAGTHEYTVAAATLATGATRTSDPMTSAPAAAASALTTSEMAHASTYSPGLRVTNRHAERARNAAAWLPYMPT